MLPSDEYGLVPKFGLEIEVPTWKAPFTRRDVVQGLLEAEHMPDDATAPYIDGTHNYHCDCRTCRSVTAGTAQWPVQTILQYDATLPEEGGEFITSPMLCTSLFFKGLREIWDIVCENAIWTDQMPDRRGRKCSPSIHIHVSVDNPFQRFERVETMRAVLFGFMPELFKLASTCGIVRGVEYRSPDQRQGHHSALNAAAVARTRIDPAVLWATTDVRETPDPRRPEPRAGVGDAVRLEWRMFEAAYQDWDYVSGAIVLACALTQMVANPDTIGVVEGAIGLLDKKPKMESVNAKQLMAQFSKPRFRFLRELVLAAPVVTEDGGMYEKLDNFLQRVKVSGKTL